MANPYAATANVVSGTTDALAIQYNSLRAELRAAIYGAPVDHTGAATIAYTGWKINTSTLTDSAGDECDITCVSTYTYTGWQLTSIASVFDAAEMSQTVTTTYTWTGNKLTGIGRVIT